MPSSRSIVSAAVLLGASAVNAQMSTTTCAEVHIFLAKGNNEPYPGRQGKLVTAICDGLASCDYEDIVMDNMIDDEYCGAVYQGATNGYSQINDYNSRCPDAKLVLSGYSQGGHVASDILGGGGGTFYNDCTEDTTSQLSSSSDAGKMIKAALTFGNVRHTADQPYNYESGAADDSYFPRDSAMQALLDEYEDVWRDYCVSGDPICAQGDTVADHLSYFDVYTDSAAEWVKGLLDAETCDDCSTTLTVATSGWESSTVAATASNTGTSVPATATPTGTSGTSTATILPEATASTTENLSSTPTASATGSASSTGSSGSTPNSESVSLFSLVVAAGFAFFLV